MAQIIGNIQPTMKSGFATTSAVRGVGAVNKVIAQGSYVQVAAKSGEVVRLNVNQIQPLGGPGIALQASVDVTVRYSLGNPELAVDPELYQDVPWTSSESISEGDISAVNNGRPFTAIEITFSDNGIFCLYSR